MKSRILVLLFAVACLVPFAKGQSTKLNLPDGSGQMGAQAFAPVIWSTTKSGFVFRDSADGQAAANALSASGGGQPVSFANPSTTVYRNTAVSSTPVLVKSSAGMIYGTNYINTNASPVYVKYYDSAAPTVGTTVPIATILVPANGAYNIVRNGFPHGAFATAISLAVVTGIADNSTTAPTTPILIQLSYQ